MVSQQLRRGLPLKRWFAVPADPKRRGLTVSQQATWRSPWSVRRQREPGTALTVAAKGRTG